MGQRQRAETICVDHAKLLQRDECVAICLDLIQITLAGMATFVIKNKISHVRFVFDFFTKDDAVKVHHRPARRIDAHHGGSTAEFGVTIAGCATAKPDLFDRPHFAMPLDFAMDDHAVGAIKCVARCCERPCRQSEQRTAPAGSERRDRFHVCGLVSEPGHRQGRGGGKLGRYLAA